MQQQETGTQAQDEKEEGGKKQEDEPSGPGAQPGAQPGITTQRRATQPGATLSPLFTNRQQHRDWIHTEIHPIDCSMHCPFPQQLALVTVVVEQQALQP